MATIREIAKKAKVSPSTVSRVLNNDQTLSVAQNTRERIYRIAEELHYNTLKSRKRKINNKNITEPKIGIIIWCSYEEEIEDPYFLSIRKGIESACSKMGIMVNKLIRLNDENTFQINDLDGLIIIGKVSSNTLLQVKNELDHVVVINDSPDINFFDSVVIDFESATKNVLELLISLGHNNIGFIGGKEYEANSKNETKELRLETYKKFMQEIKGKEVIDHDIYRGEFSMSEGYKLMKKAISKGHLPTSFFIASDSMAIGALRALQESGLHVPKDVSIVGFNDIQVASFTNPPLTTIKVFTEKMGEIAVKLLLDKWQGRDFPLKVVVPTRLMIRESCRVLGSVDS
ncbi:LacI family transcriptional regulator [Pullulanibacillus pueri]|uniref:Putative HTH-type transcriptional regulator MsmR n=1 Tax=Pullulanibacillus pueri TaxID=1437324 RepID=A0A8J3A3H3_9BACL|nr:LacI family DNA-binding transcriptional regulator [Pullulanibacillus pueri]MBM7683020.1 LacI family transcriptional regulator [Pullulanibacillus pueri]GGH89096.1 putative HTH-type transcriptional regulator MsmR [Pullulanibacillus pueri]